MNKSAYEYKLPSLSVLPSYKYIYISRADHSVMYNQGTNPQERPTLPLSAVFNCSGPCEIFFPSALRCQLLFTLFASCLGSHVVGNVWVEFSLQ